jgi:nucleotide-binding universal stress UspA family protein
MTDTARQCPRCDLRFRLDDELAHHLATEHTLEPAFGDGDSALPSAPAGPTPDVVTVPLDPSRPPTAALDVAVALARAGGYAVEVVAAPVPGVPATGRYLGRRQRELAAAGVATVAPGELQGDPAGAIVAHAAARPSALLCLARRAHGRLAERVLGSVSARVVRDATVPVVLVGPEARHAGTPTRRLLVGVDGSRAAYQGLAVAARLADRLGTEVELIEVTSPRAPVLDTPQDVHLREAAHDLGVTPAASYVVHDEDPARGLVERAGPTGDTLLVVGSHGLAGAGHARHAVLGGVAQGVVRHAAGPVLVVPRGAWVDGVATGAAMAEPSHA